MLQLIDANKPLGLRDDFFELLPKERTQQFTELIAFCETNKLLILRHLQPLASTLADAVGFESFFRFILHNGGRRIYFPSRAIECNERLHLKMSAEDYGCFLLVLSTNRTLEVPSHWGIYSVLRRVHIILDMEDGLTDREVFLKYGVSYRFLIKLKKDIHITSSGRP